MEYKGFVYKLVCDDGFYYFGCTKNELHKRFYWHKYAAQAAPQRKVNRHILQLGWEHVKIALVEEVLCKNRQELLRKESEYIEKQKCDMFCLNSCVSISLLTKLEMRKRYAQENPEKIVAYREANREYYRKYAKEYYRKNKLDIHESVDKTE